MGKQKCCCKWKKKDKYCKNCPLAIVEGTEDKKKDKKKKKKENKKKEKEI